MGEDVGCDEYIQPRHGRRCEIKAAGGRRSALDSVWPTMSGTQKQSISDQVNELFLKLRGQQLPDEIIERKRHMF
jgi:hypothetical protein